MFVIFFILMMASIGIFIIGMINPNRVKMNGRLKVFAVSSLSLCIFTISFILSIIEPEDPKERVFLDIEEQQTNVKELSNAFNARNASARGVEEGILKEMGKVESGESSVYELYRIADSAKHGADKSYNHLKMISVSRDIPDSLNRKMNDARDDASYGFLMKRKSYESLLRFLDNQNPSDLNEFEQRFAEASTHIIKAELLIKEIEKEVGLIEEENEGAN